MEASKYSVESWPVTSAGKRKKKTRCRREMRSRARCIARAERERDVPRAPVLDYERGFVIINRVQVECNSF